MRNYNIISKILPLKALLLDVDGVLTPGGIWFSDSGDQFKRFDVKDGLALVALRASGIRLGIITGKNSQLVERRACELGIEDVYQDYQFKNPAIEDFASKYSLELPQIGFIGDDVIDISAMKACGFCACPSDAAPAVKRIADWVAREKGGMGAIREIVEIILAAKSGTYPPDMTLTEWANKLAKRR